MARSFEKDYHINGDNFERSYKETISGFKIWEDADHAEDWVIIPKNMGAHLSIDETCEWFERTHALRFCRPI